VRLYWPPILSGVWEHWVGTYDGSFARFYKDGVEVESVATTTACRVGTGDATIGRLGVPARYIGGVIDDVRVYNRALPADEVKRLYGLGATTKIAKTIDSNPDINEGLAAHWTFDGAEVYSVVTDHSTNTNNGYLAATMATNTAIVPGKIGQALRFDGSDDFVEIPHHASLDYEDTDFSLAAWVKFDSLSGEQYILYKDDTGGSAWGYLFRMLDTEETIRFTTSAGGYDHHTTPSYELETDRWYHVVAVHDNANTRARIYVDGVLKVDGLETGNDDPTDLPLYIGAWEGTESFFDGVMDDVRIYNRASNVSSRNSQATYGCISGANTTRCWTPTYSNMWYTPVTRRGNFSD